MNIFFIDEQEGKHRNRSYTAVCVAKISAGKMYEFRRAYYSKLYDLIGDFHGTKQNVVDNRHFVHVHGSNLLREYPDTLKIEVVEHLLSCFAAVDGEFFRLGYYDDTMPSREQKDRNSRVNMCMMSFLLSLPEKASVPFCFTSEFDREGLRKIFGSLSDHIPMSIKLDPTGSMQNTSFDYKNFVGHFYATKSDIGCQLADIGGYLALKKQTNTSQFSEKLAKLYSKFENLYEIDEIISLNVASPDEISRRHKEDTYRPIRGWADIVPRD